jgi:hypothetical protein
MKHSFLKFLTQEARSRRVVKLYLFSKHQLIEVADRPTENALANF